MSTCYRNSQLALEVTVSRQAEKMIGPKNVPELVRVIKEIMEAFGAERAYVGKRGVAVEISVIRSDSWTGVMKLKRGK